MEDSGIYFVHRALVPVRSEPSDSAEMVTQLLFGDLVSLLVRDRQWMRVRNLDDAYEGWIDRKMVMELGLGRMEALLRWEYVLAPALALEWRSDAGTLPLHLSLGCRFPVFDGAGEGPEWVLELGGHALRVGKESLCRYESAGPADLVAFSARYLGAPYLWGGKSLWGIDCSGFTQICHAVCGKKIPRDASQQELAGEEVGYDERKAGDLAFFKNDRGRVHHVGIVLENGLVRHASGCVHDAQLSRDGIIDIEQQKLTHILCSIKRIC